MASLLSNKNTFTIGQEHDFKIKIINILNLIFIFFASIYLIYFFIQEEWRSFLAILSIISFFVVSIYLNYIKKHFASKFLLISATQIGNFVFSLYLGFDSGVHLYNLTSPLITLLIFNFKNKNRIFSVLTINLLNILLQIIINQNNWVTPIKLSPFFVRYFYDLNVLGTLVSLTLLTYYFASINNHINKVLKLKNKFLVRNLQEKELLLTEIHHRVKNNLAQISAILQLQLFNLDNPVAQEELLATQRRIKAIALIQEKIYQNDSISSVSLDLLINMLSVNSEKILLTSLNTHNGGDLDINRAIPFYLLLNELLLYVENEVSDTVKIEIQLIKNISLEIKFIINKKIGLLNKNFTSSDIVDALVLQLKSRLDYYESSNETTYVLYIN